MTTQKTVHHILIICLATYMMTNEVAAYPDPHIQGATTRSDTTSINRLRTSISNLQQQLQQTSDVCEKHLLQKQIDTRRRSGLQRIKLFETLTGEYPAATKFFLAELYNLSDALLVMPSKNCSGQ